MFINQLKTFVLLVAIGALLVLAGKFVGGSTGAFIALMFAIVMNFFAYYYSDKMVLKAYGAQPLSRSEYPQIYEMVSELSIKSGIPMPKLYLIDQPMANAFATGRNPQNSSVAVTRGIMDLLDADELRGVLAHEVSHIKNRDILIATVAATFAMAIGYIASIMRWSLIFGGGNSENRGGLGTLVAAILMPIGATMIQLAISRSREFEADSTGAKVSQSPLSLASALQKISDSAKASQMQPQSYAQQAASSMFICNPFSAKNFSNLFSTHPRVEDRVEKLRKMQI